ncbi:zinc transporter ZntB [Cognatishimia maritima]|uniref:Zinc transporter n=1 Tax=Cognatishimia maritima TaxID=870908 RepID=A0A1M5L886_9RHOB|nr:zinc transporter ZntB [Cognatishimia maritima]SHG61312.1 zinc transporter [Cognatishimia maritima]
MSKTITPIAAFDITPDAVTPVTSDWPAPAPVAGYRWLHFDLNHQDFADWVADHMPEIAGLALQQSETRPRCEMTEDGLILNLRAVNLNPESAPEDMVSLRMWITETTIVSARLRKVWAVDAIRQKAVEGKAPESLGQFLAELTHKLTHRIETVSVGLGEDIDQLEDDLENGVHLRADRLNSLRQTVIKFRRFINPQREAIAELSGLDSWVFSARELGLLRETSNRTRRIVEELDALRDRLSAMQDHIEAERAHALTRNSYVLSVVAAIFLPLGFLTGLFGVNVAGMPGTETDMAFWLLTLGSVASGVALFLIFKFAKWL